MIIEKWIEKTKNGLSKAKKYTIHYQSYDLDVQYIKELKEEFKTSQFSMGSIDGFLDRCTKTHIYKLGNTKISIICNNLSQFIRKKITISLFRIECIRQLFSLKKELNIVLLPINEKRRKPENHQVIHPRHINGAYTYVSDGRIYVYRLEEWPKVILHEVLHNVPRLQDVKWSDMDIQRLYAQFSIDMKGCPTRCRTLLEPTEAIIETWAIFMHTIFISIEYGKDFKKLLQMEIKWNDKHTRWILDKQNSYMDGTWHEHTHAFSYIVLRGIIMHNLEKFLGMKTPYRGDRIVSLLLNNWQELKENIMKIPNRNRKTLRMSRFGHM